MNNATKAKAFPKRRMARIAAVLALSAGPSAYYGVASFSAATNIAVASMSTAQIMAAGLIGVALIGGFFTVFTATVLAAKYGINKIREQVNPVDDTTMTHDSAEEKMVESNQEVNTNELNVTEILENTETNLNENVDNINVRFPEAEVVTFDRSAEEVLVNVPDIIEIRVNAKELEAAFQTANELEEQGKYKENAETQLFQEAINVPDQVEEQPTEKTEIEDGSAQVPEPVIFSNNTKNKARATKIRVEDLSTYWIPQAGESKRSSRGRTPGYKYSK